MIVTGVGRVADDVTLQKGQSGIEYVSINIAHDRGFGEKKATDWYRCTAYGEVAKRMANAQIKKGTPLLISGTLALESYVNKDKVEKQSVKINILDWNFVVSSGKPKKEADGVAVASADDELPLM